jgi:glycerol kinase
MDRDQVLIVLDQGTSTTRALAFDPTGNIVAYHTHALHTLRPRPGPAEMNSSEVLDSVDTVLHRTLADVAGEHRLPAALGLSVQRSSFLLWDETAQAAATPILTWQDIRAAEDLPRFADQAESVAHITGIPLGPYYGGPKFAHLARRSAADRTGPERPATRFIPLESLLIHHLTGQLLIDETIAGRTLVFDIHHRQWSDELLELFGLPRSMLPELVLSQSDFGRFAWQGRSIPLMVSMGDQQAAMTGLGACEPAETAINLGTSGSVALHTGAAPRPTPGLLANVAFSTPDEIEYLLEGTINAVGALFTWFAQQWDQPNLPRHWPDQIAASTDLVMIPGVNGLAAPYWRSDIPTTFIPDKRDYAENEELRAGMESVAFLVSDILQAMSEGEEGFVPGEIHIGGGMAQPPLLQFLADILQHPLHLHRVREATAHGVAIRLAQALKWPDFPTRPERETSYQPAVNAGQRDGHINRWRRALEQALGSTSGN